MDELTKIALVGTSKHAGPWPAPEHPAVEFVMGEADDDRERSLLLQCGARAVYDLAGRKASVGIEPVVPAPAETNKTASPRLAALLQSIASTGAKELLIDCLQQMKERLVILPPDVLPILLQSKESKLRQCLIPILGERGRWLCRQNPDWSNFLTNGARETQVDFEALKQSWDEGTIEARCQALGILRRHDPVTARDWVAQGHAKEKSNHRLKLVESLETGLGDDDEAFLESCLDDRSAAVGAAAARLLCRLPGSALAGRMRDRALAILVLERTGLVNKKNKLICTHPQVIDRDWERDGIAKRAPAGLGERAFWTERVLAAVPPAFWRSQLGMEPEVLITAVADDPFAWSVVAGWTEAAIKFAASDRPSAEWIMPLWRHWATTASGLQGADRVSALGRMQTLLPLMSPDLAEAAVAGMFDPAPGWGDIDVLGFLPALSRPWSARFGAAFLLNVRRQVQSQANQAAYQWAHALAAAACSIPADLFPLALEPWEVAAPEQPATWFIANIQQAIDSFVTAIETRQRFMSELNT